jgi:hypothetical protein
VEVETDEGAIGLGEVGSAEHRTQHSRSQTQAQIHSDYFKFVGAWLASVLEDNISEIQPRDGNLKVALGPFQTVTLRVRTDRVPMRPILRP